MLDNDETKTLMTPILEMDARLRLIEVRGDSVEMLFSIRMIMKGLVEEIEKLKKKPPEEIIK